MVLIFNLIKSTDACWSKVAKTKDMFMFNASVMGYAETDWMRCILDHMGAMARNAEKPNLGLVRMRSILIAKLVVS